MNRAERRAVSKATPAYRRGMSAEDLIKKMSINGITPQQYDEWGRKEYERGYSEGHRRGGEEAIMVAYASLCTALKSLYGWDRDKCYDVLRETDKNVMYYINSDEAIEDVYTKLGLYLDFHDALERVKEA